jgi:hypothetical protein
MARACLLSREEIRFLLCCDAFVQPQPARETLIQLDHYLKMAAFSKRLRKKRRRRGVARPAA